MGINEFLKTILEWIYGFVGNYGWAVVLFTLLVRLIVMPFDYKSSCSFLFILSGSFSYFFWSFACMGAIFCILRIPTRLL